jgi:RNA polymerase sigma factor (sigma-70 family)
MAPRSTATVQEPSSLEWSEHRTMLKTYAARIAPRAEVEDLVQQTIQSFLEAFMDKQPPDNVDHWLMRALMNRFYDQCRKADVRDRSISDPTLIARAGPQPVGLPDLSGELTLSEQLIPAALEGAVAQLPEKARVTYRLHMKGLKNGDIASQLGIDSGTVAKRLHDARKMLCKLLTPLVDRAEP